MTLLDATGNPDGGDDRREAWSFWVRTVKTLGPTTIIALVLVYFLVTNVNGSLETSQQILQQHSLTSNLEMQSLQEQTRRMERLLQQICANTAADPAIRNDCFR